jgi:hypothetical protein
MEGYRALESGDLRVSESGVFRTTEGFNLGEASFTAVGSKITASAFGAIGLVIVSASGSMSSTGTVTRKGIKTFGGVGSLQAQADVFLIVSSFLSGVGSLTVSGGALRAATGALTGSSVLAPAGTRIRYGISGLSGEGFVVSVASKTLYGFYGKFVQEAVRVTELNDTRITEDGNTRVTYPLIYNGAEGTLVGDTVYTRFNVTASVNRSGVWKRIVPSAKYNGAWRLAQKVYKKISGNWKRIY